MTLTNTAVLSMTSTEAATNPDLQPGQMIILRDRECGTFEVVQNYTANGLNILDCPAAGVQLNLQIGEYLYAGHLGIKADYDKNTGTGSKVGAQLNEAIYIGAVHKKRLQLASTNHAGNLGYGIDQSLNVANLYALHGQGDNTLLIQAADVPVISATFSGRGVDFVNVGNMVIQGDKEAGFTAPLVEIDNCHVPTSLERVSVLNGGGSNIVVRNSTVVTFYQVWSNRPEKHCLEIDTCRSFNMVGGACEHAGEHHIKITNSGNVHSPVANFTMLHTEGLEYDDMSVFAIGGGDEYTGTQSVGISGWQILGKNWPPVNNNGITLLNSNVSIKADNIAKTGGSELCDQATFNHGEILPTGYMNSMPGLFLGKYDSVFNGAMGTTADIAIKGMQSGKAGINPWTVKQITVTLPNAQPDADYSPQVTLEGFLGANRNWYIDNITDTSFRINVIDASNGALAQTSKAATFHWSVPVKH